MPRPLYLSLIGAAAALIAQSAAAGVETTDAAKIPAGAYELDPSHASVAARVNHLGFSTTTVRFPKVSARFVYDPLHPQASQLDVTVETASLTTDWPERDRDLKSPAFFNVAAFPTAQYTANALTPLDASHARVDGQLTLLGVTRPVSMDVALVGSGLGMMNDRRAGFSAHLQFKRSDFGMKTFLPAVGDTVDVAIDAEFAKK